MNSEVCFCGEVGVGENFTPHLGVVKNRPKNAKIKKKKRHETLKQLS